MCIAYQGSLNSVDDIIKGIENGDIPLTNNIQKGNYGEMKMDAYFEGQGYERVSFDRVTDLDAPTHQGIDGIYYNPDGYPPYIIGEAKYGSSKLSKLVDGTPQMSETWILDRLEGSVDMDTYLDILDKGYESKLFHVEKTGIFSINKIDEVGKINK